MSRVQYHNCLIFSSVILHLPHISVLSRYTFSLVWQKCTMISNPMCSTSFQCCRMSSKVRSLARSPFNLHIQHGFSIDMSEWRIINPFKLAPKYQAQIKSWRHKRNLQHFLWLFLANHVRSSGAFLPRLMSRVCWIIDAPHLFRFSSTPFISGTSLVLQRQTCPMKPV